MSSSVELWDLEEGQVANWPFPGVRLSSPVFSPRGDMLICRASDYGTPEDAYRNHRIVILDLGTGKTMQTLRDAPDDARRREFKFTPDGTRLLVRRTTGVRFGNFKTGPVTMWDWNTGKRIEEPSAHLFGSDDISPDGRYELRLTPHGVDVIDRTLKRPNVVSRRSE